MTGCCKIATVLLLVLFCYVNNIRAQANKGVIGIPLPSFKRGQGQRPRTLNNLNNDITKVLSKSSHINSGSSRGLGALQYINNPSEDAYVQKLAVSPVVLQTIQNEIDADEAIRIHSILTAHKQVVSGQIIYLGLKVVKTNCPAGRQDVRFCQEDVSKDPYVCEMAVWERPWLNSTKIIHEKSSCAEVEDDASFKNWMEGSDDKYEDGFFESPSHTLSDSVDTNQIALEAFNYIDHGSDSSFKGELIGHSISSIKSNPSTHITKVVVKIEYGFTMCIKMKNLKVDTRVCPKDVSRRNYLCSVTMALDPKYPLTYKVVPDDTDDIKCYEKQAVEELLVVPVKAPCTGCPQSVSTTDEKILDLADFALVEYDRSSDDDELHMMLKLIKAHYQVESSVKYFITMELAETNCKKSFSAINMNRSFCNQDLTEETEICDMIVLDQPWQKSRELILAKCSDAGRYNNNKRDELIVPVLGETIHSSVVAHPTTSTNKFAPLKAQHDSIAISDTIQDSIDFVVDYINHLETSAEDDDGLLVLQKIHKTETKTSRAGEEHYLVLELGETICTRYQKLDNCPLKYGEENEVCDVRIVRSGSGNSSRMRILHLSCDDLDDYMKKELTPYVPLHEPFFALLPEASSRPANTQNNYQNDSAAIDIAAFIVNQYNLQSDDDELYKLGRIVTFFSQSPNKEKFMVELELLETECKKYQPVSDVSKCPTEPGEEPEFCQAEVMINSQSKPNMKLTRLYCDDREDFFTKKMIQLKPETHMGEWKTEDVASAKIKSIGNLISDEFDERSDDDNIVRLHRVVEAKSLSPGLKYYLHVELSETVCPKYKPRINKTRCMIDHTEELKVCHAEIDDQPWRNGQQVTKLSCTEKGGSREDHSIEVVYRDVHTTAHARPRFPQSLYKHIGSQESDESNEVYYTHGSPLHNSGYKDSDEIIILRNGPTTGTAAIPFRRRAFTRDDDDSDNEKDSRSFERVRFRGKRDVQQTLKEPSSILGKAEVVQPDDALMELASKALMSLDTQSREKKARKVENILQATKKPINSGWQWTLMLRVARTTCSMKYISTTLDLSSCKVDLSASTYLCSVTVTEKSSQELYIKKSKCYAELS